MYSVERLLHDSEFNVVFFRFSYFNQVRPGGRFTNGFSIAIQIRWKFRFTPTSIVIPWSLQIFVHGTTVVLSWHVMCKNLLRFDGQQRSYDKAKFPSYLNCGQKTVSETGPWLCYGIYHMVVSKPHRPHDANILHHWSYKNIKYDLVNGKDIDQSQYKTRPDLLFGERFLVTG